MAEMVLDRIRIETEKNNCILSGIFKLGDTNIGTRWRVTLTPICERGGFLFFSGDCETVDPEPGKEALDWVRSVQSYTDEGIVPGPVDDDLYRFEVCEVTRTREDDCQRIRFEWGWWKRNAANPLPIYKATGLAGGPLGLKAGGRVSEVFDSSGQFIVRVCCRESEEGECGAFCELVSQEPPAR